jgi:hypothetical protein
VFTNEPMIRSNAPRGFAVEFSPDYVLRTLVGERTPGGIGEHMAVVGEAVESYRKVLRAAHM